MSGKQKFEGFPQLVTDMDWARMAAFLDGEGCIRIQMVPAEKRKRAKSPWHMLILVMGNTDPRLALWCSERFGGNLYFRQSSKRNSRHRDAFVWHCNSKRAEAVIRGCLPHFVLKREQAETALAFCEIAWTQLAGESLPQELIDKREILRKKLESEKTRKFELVAGFRKMA
jgi:hypothetical protein